MLVNIISVVCFLVVLISGLYLARRSSNYRMRDYAMSFAVILSLVGFFAPQFVFKHHYADTLNAMNVERSTIIDDYMDITTDTISSEEKQEKLDILKARIDDYNSSLSTFSLESKLWDLGISAEADSMILVYNTDTAKGFILDYTAV